MTVENQVEAEPLLGAESACCDLGCAPWGHMWPRSVGILVSQRKKDSSYSGSRCLSSLTIFWMLGLCFYSEDSSDCLGVTVSSLLDTI